MRVTSGESNAVLYGCSGDPQIIVWHGVSSRLLFLLGTPVDVGGRFVGGQNGDGTRNVIDFRSRIRWSLR